MRTLNVLELFAGSRSIGNACNNLGINCFSVDIEPFDNINLVADIETLKISDIPFVPDFVWASPDCTTYTIAAISHHRNGTQAKSEYAKKCDSVNANFINLIEQWLKVNPNMVFYIENPRGMMRKMPFIKNFDRATITYCSYGDNRMKPTDLWSNNIYSMFNTKGWKPKPMCFNNNDKCHHEKAPRGSRTGTQGLDGSYNRSKIPNELCKEILTNLINNL